MFLSSTKRTDECLESSKGSHLSRSGGSWGLSSQAEQRVELSADGKKKNKLKLPIILGGPNTGTAAFKQPGLPVLLLWFPGSDLQWSACQSVPNSLPGHPHEPRGGVFCLVDFLRSPSLFTFSRFGASLVRSSPNSQSLEIKKTFFWPLFHLGNSSRLVAAWFHECVQGRSSPALCA